MGSSMYMRQHPENAEKRSARPAAAQADRTYYKELPNVGSPLIWLAAAHRPTVVVGIFLRTEN